MMTTSDKELLELAAKAAGIEVQEWRESYEAFKMKEPMMYWNPLTDDGDALRLAVKLNISVIPYDDETSTGTFGVVAKNFGSKEENTRRAIVRAAAAIGESM